jgi:hypothetical protein
MISVAEVFAIINERWPKNEADAVIRDYRAGGVWGRETVRNLGIREHRSRVAFYRRQKIARAVSRSLLIIAS